MTQILSLIDELNSLCQQYVAQKDEFKEHDRIKAVFNAIRAQGYNIVTPQITYTTPEFELLSEDGKGDFEKFVTIRELKKEEVKALHFERAGDLRDIERELTIRIKNDFTNNTANQYFILPEKNREVVIFNDPDGNLKALFKYGDREAL